MRTPKDPARPRVSEEHWPLAAPATAADVSSVAAAKPRLRRAGPATREETPTKPPICENDQFADPEEEAPATSRSHELPVPAASGPGLAKGASARAQLDELAAEIRALMAQVRQGAVDEYGHGPRLQETTSVIRTALSAIRLYGQLTGELGQSEAAVLASPHVKKLLADILEALAPFPEASRAVLARLERSEVAA